MSSSSKSDSIPHYFVAILLGGIMVAIGWFATKTLVWNPMSSYFSARSWQQVSCTIQESRLGRATGPKRDGRESRVEVTYTYSLRGKEYSSSRYDLLGAYTTTGQREKREILARYPKGARTPCWVNPENPREAVLNRDFSADYLVGSLFSLFIPAGLSAIGWALFQIFNGPQLVRRQRKAKTRRSQETPEEAVQRRLKPRVPITRTVIGGSVLAVIWNGAVWIMLSRIIEGWRRGAPDGCLTLFVIPFLLVGLLLIWAVVAPIVMLFNPPLKLTISRTTLRPGQSAILQWKIHGKAERVRRLRILLHAPNQEDMFDNRDADDDSDTELEAETETDTENDWDTLTIVDTDQPMLIAEGTAEIKVPLKARFLFDEDTDQLAWMLKTYCEIPRWPDSVEEHTIIVKPGAER